MPYQWVPPRLHKYIPVLDALPHGIVEQREYLISTYREASGRDDQGIYREFYYCHHCKGWIEGSPTAHGEHSLGPLCGRSGTVYECQRCEQEIGFMGIVS